MFPVDLLARGPPPLGLDAGDDESVGDWRDCGAGQDDGTPRVYGTGGLGSYGVRDATLHAALGSVRHHDTHRGRDSRVGLARVGIVVSAEMQWRVPERLDGIIISAEMQWRVPERLDLYEFCTPFALQAPSPSPSTAKSDL